MAFQSNPNVCIVQSKPGLDKETNITNAFKQVEHIECDILVLPECFNSPYGIEYFETYAEEIKPGEYTYDKLQEQSFLRPSTYIIAGSIPEKDGDKYYNTCTVWYAGAIICKYSKINLFDIDIKSSGTKFEESSVLSPGTEPAYFETEWGRIGLGICFDLRFNKLANYYAEQGCFMIIYPGCFTEYTGDLHWELLLRARAVDNRCYTIGCATALNKDMDYRSYGHSMIVSPWGKVLKQLDNKEGYIISTINSKDCISMKESIPPNSTVY